MESEMDRDNDGATAAEADDARTEGEREDPSAVAADIDLNKEGTA